MATKQKIPAIKDKPAIFGKAIRVSNMRTRDEEGEDGGDAGELKPGREVLITKLLVARKFASSIIGNDLVYDAIFDKGKKPIEPDGNLCIDALKLNVKFKGCSAEIVFGVSQKKIEVDNARIKNIWLKPVTGGVFEMRFALQGIMPRKLDVLDLEEQIGKEITISIKFGELDDVAEQAGQKDFVEEQQRREAGDEGDAPIKPVNGGNGRPGVQH